MWQVYTVSTPELCGLAVCGKDWGVKEMLKAEGIDITQCSVEKVDRDMCYLNRMRSEGIYTEKKLKTYTEVAPPTSLGEDLYKQHLSGKGCDVVLKVEDSHIPCHKLVLSARSKYFEAMFSSAFSSESKQKEIEIEGFSYSMVDAMVKFMYNSKVHVEHDPAGPDIVGYLKLMEATLVLADYFDVPSLISYIEQKILFICNQNELGLDMTHAQALVDIHTTAGQRGLRNLQKIVATYMPMQEDLRAMDLTVSMQEDITSTFPLQHRTQFYFGSNHKLHTLLESGDLSSKNILDDVAKLEAQGADAAAIHAGHTCIRRLCAKDASHSVSLQAIMRYAFLYFMNQRSYPVDSVDHLGQTMLHIAAVARKVGLVRLLINKGASTNVSDANGLPVARAVLAAFDRELADALDIDAGKRNLDMFANSDTWTAEYNNMQEIHDMIPLYKHDWDSLSKKCKAPYNMELNEDFIAETASNYLANKPLISSLTEYQYPFLTGKRFSNNFLKSVMRNRFRCFMTFMKKKKKGEPHVDITWVKQKIRECLIRDLTDWHLERCVKPSCLCETGMSRVGKHEIDSLVERIEELSDLYYQTG